MFSGNNIYRKIIEKNMPTHSLILRQTLGRKLTLEELDNNFLHFEESISEISLTSSIDIPEYQVLISDGMQGITGSSCFIFDFNNFNLLASQASSIGECIGNSSIIGGYQNCICSSDVGSGTPSSYGSSIIGGYGNEFIKYLTTHLL